MPSVISSFEKVQTQGVTQLLRAQTTEEGQSAEFSNTLRSVQSDASTLHPALRLKGRWRKVHSVSGQLESKKLELGAILPPPPPPPPTFSKESVLAGSWGEGKLSINGLSVGMYEVSHSNAQIRFEINGFHGIITSKDSVTLYNDKTGEAYTAKLLLTPSEFKLAEFQPIPSQPKTPSSPPLAKGERVGNLILFEGMTMELLDNGRVKVSIHPELSHDMTAEFTRLGKLPESKLTGDGFIDKNGNLVLGFSNGAIIRAPYAMHGQTVSLYKFELLN